MEQIDQLEREGVNTIGKQHFTSLFSPARERAFTLKNIKAGFADAHTLDDTSKQKLEKHVRKLTKAGQMDGEGMSYKDLEEARAKRAEKEAAREAKGKGKRGRKCKSATLEAEEATADEANRGRKRKSTVPEADAPEPKVKVARISNAPESARGSVVQMSGTLVVEDEIVPDPLRAPVARMW
ncbi:hypothetical protein MMC16_002343 [Acarospora aff. strigata]|nr:hypothetical protein [Acarospora aff. strigata]